MANSVIYIWTDGVNNGRGYDGTLVQTHYHQTTQTKTPDLYHGASATESLQFNRGVAYAVTTANEALSYVEGLQGPQGYQGVHGVNGSQGLQGNQGATGSQGYQGANGNNGAQGSQGNQGMTGAQGYQGNNGAQGYQGAQGYKGSTGLYEGATAPADTTIIWADTSTTGYPGPQGPQGAQGYNSNALYLQINTAFNAPNNIAETFSRLNINVSGSGRVTTQSITASAVYLQAGQVVNNITWSSSSSSGSGITGQWAGIFSYNGSTLKQLAHTSTVSGSTIAANSYFTWPLSSTYTVPASGLYYVGICITGSNPPSINGLTLANGLSNSPPYLALGANGTVNPGTDNSTTYSATSFGVVFWFSLT